jgi:hypothetical protein
VRADRVTVTNSNCRTIVNEVCAAVSVGIHACSLFLEVGTTATMTRIVEYARSTGWKKEAIETTRQCRPPCKPRFQTRTAATTIKAIEHEALTE